jgi:RNA polymerase sigma-70 factor, ECF subfamily
MSPETSIDEHSFDDILETCRHFLLAIANDELPDDLRAKGGASDLVQETLAAAHRSRLQFRGQTLGDLRAWLRGILLNESAMFKRRYYSTSSRDVAREVPLVPGVALPQSGVPPTEELSRREEYQALAYAVDRLPGEYREVVLLHFEHNLTYSEIGERIGKSEEAARKLCGRALGQLKDAFPSGRTETDND